MDRTGLYGRFNLDGAPLDPADAAALALPPPLPDAAQIAHAIDLADPGAVHIERSADALTMLLGRIDEPAALAARLGMAADTPAALLARAALDRFGDEVRSVMTGEWTLLHHANGTLILAASIARRDVHFYAQKGARLAIGPDLRQLGRLGWTGSDLSDTGLLLAFAPGLLHDGIAGLTSLADIQVLGPGGMVTFDAKGHIVAARAVPVQAPRWSGNFDEAMEEAGALLRRIVRQRMWGERIGCMVSGGLDSSTIAAILAQNRRPSEALRFFTSAAPPASGLADEVEFAEIVARHLSVPLTEVAPDPGASPYRPTPAQFRERNGPNLGPRHYLYGAFAGAAEEAGIPLLFDGQYGEYTFTYPFPLDGMLTGLKARLGALRPWRAGHRVPPGLECFQVLLAPHWRGRLPDPVSAALASPPVEGRMATSRESWGFVADGFQAMRPPASLALGRVRVAYPFRDPRLLTLFSGFRAGMLQQRGVDRAPVRHILKGHLPDSIRLRPKGLHFSPDYHLRLQQHAPAARARIAAFRACGADAWLDLEALDAGLARVASATLRGTDDALLVQMTAIAAEFIAWWRGGS